MTKDKLKQVAQFYLDYLNREWPNYTTRQFEADTQMHEQSRGVHFKDEVSHLKFMCIKMQEIADTNMEKAFRWLGFLQGVCWARGYFTLDQLKNHSRPEDLTP